MARGDGLGRVFNVIPIADGIEVSLEDAAAVTFVCTLTDGDTFTLAESVGAGGTPQALACIERYHTNTEKDGSTAWTRVEQAAASTVVIGTGVDVAVFTVRADQLTDGYTHVDVTSTSTGTVVAIVHDLLVQRSAENLPALGA